MRALMNGEQFCDLNCYVCDCHRLRSCLMFGFEAPFYSEFLIHLADGKIFNESVIKGLWLKYLSIDAAKCDKDLKFPVYENETCN